MSQGVNELCESEKLWLLNERSRDLDATESVNGGTLIKDQLRVSYLRDQTYRSWFRYVVFGLTPPL